MLAARLLAVPSLAAALLLGACKDDGDGLFTAPGSPASGGATFDADCENDVAAPVVGSVFPAPDLLWPPNHDMVPVTVHADAEDGCDPMDMRIVDVLSDEPANGLGDGDTSPDWEIVGPLTVRLRAERSGTGDGRVYTIRVRFADGVANERIEHVKVLVPHDNGGGR